MKYPQNVVIIDNETTRSIVCTLDPQSGEVAVYRMTPRIFEFWPDATKEAAAMNARTAADLLTVEEATGLRRREKAKASDRELRSLADPTKRYLASMPLSEAEVADQFKIMPWCEVLEIPGGFFYSRTDLPK